MIVPGGPSGPSLPSLFLMAGGYTNQSTYRNTYSSAAGLIDAAGNYCEIPPVNPRRYAHTMNGLTACGGYPTSLSIREGLKKNDWIFHISET